MDSTWLRLGDERTGWRKVAHAAADGTIYIGEWEHEMRRPVGRVRQGCVDGYERGPLQELGTVDGDGHVRRGGQHGVLVGSVTAGLVHAHGERDQPRQIGLAEGPWEREVGAAALLIPEIQALWRHDGRRGKAAGFIALAAGLLAESQPPPTEPPAADNPPARARQQPPTAAERAPARRPVRPPVQGNVKKLGFGKRGLKLGDRVECRRIKYEGIGVIEAISNDMSQGSGGTKLYPTLFVRFDDGSGDWYQSTDMTRVSSP